MWGSVVGPLMGFGRWAEAVDLTVDGPLIAQDRDAKMVHPICG
jgi:hypothetical protein